LSLDRRGLAPPYTHRPQTVSCNFQEEQAKAKARNAENRLFPVDLPERKWVQFKAHGFSEPVTGVIFKGDNPPTCGMPIGGAGTGCGCARRTRKENHRGGDEKLTFRVFSRRT